MILSMNSRKSKEKATIKLTRPKSKISSDPSMMTQLIATISMKTKSNEQRMKSKIFTTPIKSKLLT